MTSTLLPTEIVRVVLRMLCQHVESTPMNNNTASNGGHRARILLSYRFLISISFYFLIF